MWHTYGHIHPLGRVDDHHSFWTYLIQLPLTDYMDITRIKAFVPSLHNMHIGTSTLSGKFDGHFPLVFATVYFYYLRPERLLNINQTFISLHSSCERRRIPFAYTYLHKPHKSRLMQFIYITVYTGQPTTESQLIRFTTEWWIYLIISDRQNELYMAH